ncbi:MAG: hypothetical protein ACI8QD_000841 [Cyclobacteriaceae bacterium]|jgi:hypothetical protein
MKIKNYKRQVKYAHKAFRYFYFLFNQNWMTFNLSVNHIQQQLENILLWLFDCIIVLGNGLVINYQQRERITTDKKAFTFYKDIRNQLAKVRTTEFSNKQMPLPTGFTKALRTAIEQIVLIKYFHLDFSFLEKFRAPSYPVEYQIKLA